MIYQVFANITLDTRTNKVVIEHTSVNGDVKRIVLYPGKKAAEHWVDVSVNDRPQGGPFSYAKDICKFLVQNLHGRRQIKQITGEVKTG